MGTLGICTDTAALPACSSKILTQEKQHFAELAVDAIMRLKGSGNLESIHIIKKPGGTLKVGSQSLCYWLWGLAAFSASQAALQTAPSVTANQVPAR